MKHNKKNPQESLKYYCQSCNTELESVQATCPSCGRIDVILEASTGRASAEALIPSIKYTEKEKGYKYNTKKESIDGVFSSINPELSESVDKKRVIDREKDEYHETVIDRKTGRVIRDVHESLHQHKTSRKRKS